MHICNQAPSAFDWNWDTYAGDIPVKEEVEEEDWNWDTYEGDIPMKEEVQEDDMTLEEMTQALISEPETQAASQSSEPDNSWSWHSSEQAWRSSSSEQAGHSSSSEQAWHSSSSEQAWHSSSSQRKWHSSSSQQEWHSSSSWEARKQQTVEAVAHIHGKHRDHEAFRPRIGQETGRWGARGGKNKAWYTAKAKAQRLASKLGQPHILDKFLRENPKPK